MRTAAVAAAHTAAGYPSPTASAVVSRTQSGVRRLQGVRPDKKSPLTAADIVRVVNEISPSSGLLGVRDRAVLRAGFATAMRRSELAALDIGHLQFVEEGLLIDIPRSKRDQEGSGQRIAVPHGGCHCPVGALKACLDGAEIIDGPVFLPFSRGRRVLDRALSEKQIARIVKQRAARAGFDADAYSGHSLRSGFLTTAGQNRANLWKVAEVSRHRPIDTLRDYVQATELFDDHAGAGML